MRLGSEGLVFTCLTVTPSNSTASGSVEVSNLLTIVCGTNSEIDLRKRVSNRSQAGDFPQAFGNFGGTCSNCDSGCRNGSPALAILEEFERVVTCCGNWRRRSETEDPEGMLRLISAMISLFGKFRAETYGELRDRGRHVQAGQRYRIKISSSVLLLQNGVAGPKPLQTRSGLDDCQTKTRNSARPYATKMVISSAWKALPF